MDRRARTTQRIIDGAATAFAKGGFAATSMDEIAASAGVSRLLLYRDFAGKLELYEAVLDRTRTRLTAAVEHPGRSEALRAVLTVARADPDGFTLMFRHAAREPDFADFVNAFFDESVRTSSAILATIEPDPALRRWASRMTVTTTFEAVLAWLELGNPALDDAFYQRLLKINRQIAKP
jgi:AcrR family transcriptional regulator